MRVYLPSTLTAARAVLRDRTVPAGTAFAVTPALREWYSQSDTEEMEFAALQNAARACLRLLGADPDAPPRRFVFAADVEEKGVRVRDDLERGAVEVLGPVPLASVRAVHTDDPADSEAQAAVRAAVDAVLEADLGSDDAAFVVDGAEGFELLWFATQELADLL
ncbi:hypothetical protein CcI49_33230 [Frankia sp. CcI49]|uniref:DUF6912 family protein n=1 Tax=Frankia sp. CcI49 TaxID=1745382 RepID=UPI000975DF79|nr:hypothetical protein [Frankia sp. CcI49]ONH52973.1 hypothetical protein CcI49_33230 [Frankia sp. CcI49]